jgi:hypothetical protein
MAEVPGPSDGEMQVRCVRRRIPGRPHLTQELPTPQTHALGETRRVPIEVGIHENESLRPIRGVDHQPPVRAFKELEQAPVPGREHGRSARGWNIKRAVWSDSSHLREGVGKLGPSYALDRDHQARTQGCEFGLGGGGHRIPLPCPTRAQRGQGLG